MANKLFVSSKVPLIASLTGKSKQQKVDTVDLRAGEFEKLGWSVGDMEN